MSFKAIIKKYLPKKLIEDFKADQRLRGVDRWQRGAKGGIRVGFVVQMSEIWDKESPIYDAMVQDESFEPELIVVPEYDWINCRVEDDYKGNYFLSNYNNAIRAYVDGEWMSLADGSYDYVFLQRPYDHYLPEGLRSSDIAKHSKVCYIPYGFSGSNIFDKGNSNVDFFRNVTFAFLESDHAVELVKRQFVLPGERKIRNIVNLGYPALIPYFTMNKMSEGKKFLWTPRWTFDPKMGDSNFLKYRDTVIDIVETYNDTQLIFRPHPMMFDEIRRKGLMSDEEITEFAGILRNKGIIYDAGRPVLESITDADVLITDYSSIIIGFFITGKPIIYCDTGIELNNLYKKLAEGFYVVRNEEELVYYIEQLYSGNDPLYGRRKRIVEQDLMIHQNSVDMIMEMIREDAHVREIS